MDEVLSVFSVEAREQLEAMETGLMQIEQGDHDAETLNAVFRAAHTIKGSAGLFGFDAIVAFAHEARARGLEIRGADVLSLLRGDIRPEMVHALDRVRAHGFRTACLTNNMRDADSPGHRSDPRSERDAAIESVMSRFDAVVESSKVGVRKPEVRFYEIACAALDVEPRHCVFLDDLGVNLKPAAAMGMTTIKVLSADQAIGDLERILGLDLRS